MTEMHRGIDGPFGFGTTRFCTRYASSPTTGESRGTTPQKIKLLPVDTTDVGTGGDATITGPGPPGYVILRELGRGTMGVVYLAYHCRADRLVALKMIRACHSEDRVFRQRFQVEAAAAARIRHQFVVRVLDVGCPGGIHYMAIDYIKGGSLADQLDGSPWPARRAAALVHRASLGIDAAHRCAVIHRDLKPANMLMTKDGRPKIADFGLARLLDEKWDLTEPGTRIGTPIYMAPELISGEPATSATDIYALGVILYELLTGRPPFQAESSTNLWKEIQTQTPTPPRDIRPEIPARLDAICRKCLNKSRADRPTNARELAEELGKFLGFGPVVERLGDPETQSAPLIATRIPEGPSWSGVG